MTVWKYRLDLLDQQAVMMPAGARILAFQNQHGAPCLWALVDPEALATPRHILMAGTGHPIVLSGGALRYIGTAQFDGGSLVFHAFEGVPVVPMGAG